MKYLIGAFLFLFSFASVDAQMLSYSDGTTEYEGETVSTINVKLDPKPKTVRSSFENWMDDKYDVDLDGKSLLFFDKDVMSAKGVVIPEISNNKIDLMVKVDETDTNTTTLHVFASFGYDNWITIEEYPFEYMALEEIVHNYIEDYLPEYYMGKVEDSKENLAELEEEVQDINEDIQDNKEKIAKLQKENEALVRRWKENRQKIRNTNIKITKRDKDYKSIKKRVNDNK